jgi:multidrug resistance efflux pump
MGNIRQRPSTEIGEDKRMFPRTRILIGAAAVAVGLAAWEFERAEAHAKLAVDAPQSLAGIPVTSQVAGVVSALYAGVDATVRQGQALALIDSPILRARLDEAKANLEMERSAEMNAEAGVEDARSQLEYDAALDKMRQAKADVQRCELAVSDAVSASAQRWALAPIDGTVTAVNIHIGQSVEPGPRGAVLFEIAPLEVSTSSPDRKMPRRE